jgi:hypothetical protein
MKTAPSRPNANRGVIDLMHFMQSGWTTASPKRNKKNSMFVERSFAMAMATRSARISITNFGSRRKSTGGDAQRRTTPRRC